MHSVKVNRLYLQGLLVQETTSVEPRRSQLVCRVKVAVSHEYPWPRTSGTSWPSQLVTMHGAAVTYLPDAHLCCHVPPLPRISVIVKPASLMEASGLSSRTAVACYRTTVHAFKFHAYPRLCISVASPRHWFILPIKVCRRAVPSLYARQHASTGHGFPWSLASVV
jgi:hypothetical protein